MNQKRVEEIVKKEVGRYLNFKVDGVPCKVPYVFGSDWLEFWRTGGKGSVDELTDEASRLFKLYDLDPKDMTEFERYKFLRDKRCGVDCSGFVYNVLDQVMRELKGEPIKKHLLRYPGWAGELEKKIFSFKRKRRISSGNLTSDLNSSPVESVKDIKVGDIIKMKSDNPDVGHIALIYAIDKARDTITYAHSSSYTKTVGPHLAKIRVVDWNKPISEQEWLESNRSGLNLSNYAKESEGLGLRRIKVME